MNIAYEYFNMNNDFSGYYIVWKHSGAVMTTFTISNFLNINVVDIFYNCNGIYYEDLRAYRFKKEEDLLKAMLMIELIK